MTRNYFEIVIMLFCFCSVSFKNDRRCLGNEPDAKDDVRLSHPGVFNYLRQFMMQNGRVEKLVFGLDFQRSELNMIRG